MNEEKDYLFTSESVAEGHPDKLCDQVSDALLDAFLEQDENSRVAVECFVKTGFILIGGEVTSKAHVDVEAVARKTIQEIGYDNLKYGFDGKYCAVQVALSKQSPDIAQGVDSSENKEQGAGDQGLMFGYATNETPEFMPLPIILAHKILQKRTELRRSKEISYLGPDAKSQVTIEYSKGFPKKIHTVVLSTQHDENVSLEKIKRDMIEKVIKPVCGNLLDEKTIFHVNPTGRFVIGGPVGASGLADKCEVQISYAIGLAEPISIFFNCFGTNKIPEEKIEELVRKYFPLKPADIIRELDLKKPIYKKTATYGHFGRNEPEFKWEKLDKAGILRRETEKYFGIEKSKIPNDSKTILEENKKEIKDLLERVTKLERLIR